MKLTEAVAVYLRLSREDEDRRRDHVQTESASISAQRSLIGRYLDGEPALCGLPRLEFCDDGYSGTNFDRPAFRKMMELAKRGGISCIAVKDLSRFGRDYVEVGDYVEHILPFLGIRLIAVNDRYDSAAFEGRTGGMEIAFRSLIYDCYSRDLSAKVKSAVRVRQERGEFLTAAVYGYRRSAADPRRMEIDEQAAQVVRGIFNAVLSGKSASQIAADLNGAGIPTPQEYRGIRRDDALPPRWTRVRVTEMIRNIVYTGALASHKRESRQLRDGGRRVPAEEWIVHPDRHEAIIPRDTWERANAMLQTRRASPRTKKPGEDRVFRCAYCGRKLQKYGGQDPVFRCASAMYRDSPCASVELKQSEAEERILAALRERVGRDGRRSPGSGEDPATDSGRAERYAVRQAEKETELLRRLKFDCYEAFRSGSISPERCREEIEALTARIAESEEKRRAAEEKRRDRKIPPPDDERDPALLPEQAGSDRAALYRAVRQVMVSSGGRMEIEWAFSERLEGEK